MRTDRENWELAEALAPDVAAECGLKEITGRALWKMTLSIYKALSGRISYELMADQCLRYSSQSNRLAARGEKTLAIVQC